ncbi:kinase-like domain-containing protein [Gigaspora rosea]|uniref:Kinase-like domain-containing protein n=1 Tax=Gigaspora rosea TaxID=44941 RepID=A0A397U4B4_9GLOM|nr:kinase-like domain-containing protein [Gigaspora rosea]
MSTWKNGIRTIEYVSRRYIRSRFQSRVDLIKLHSSSQKNISDIIKKLNEMMSINNEVIQKGVNENEIMQKGENENKIVQTEKDYVVIQDDNGIVQIENESEIIVIENESEIIEIENENENDKKKYKIYGITKDETGQYMIVLDYYYNKRNINYGECEQCNRPNTNPKWCQSCDPKWCQSCNLSKEINHNRSLSDNDEINYCIKEFQLKAIEYDKVIEWINYSDLIEIKEIKEQEIEENLYLSMATWKTGIRTIKNVSGNYTRSRIKSFVDLIKFHSSQTTTLNVITKLKKMMEEKHRIYGITRDTRTNQYTIVLDYYYNERNINYGICEQCERPYTNPEWCQSCDPSNEVESSKNKTLSGNLEIDNSIEEFQLKATSYEKVIEWIPFEKLSNIEEIGKGGFGAVYSAIWSDGKRTVEKIDDYYKRSRRLAYIVAIKTFPGSKTDDSKFLEEFKNHMNCRLEGTELEMYGLTRYTNKNDTEKNKSLNLDVGDYLMVFQYANKGNLRKFLRENFSELTWQKKLEQLKYISNDLHLIHEAGFTHCDFHSGNILLHQNLDGKIKSYIADLGLSRKKGDGSKNEVYGVEQYVAPEVFLSGSQDFTQKSDIYGFGVIMAEITGKRPYEGHEADTKLAVKICKGLRPEFAPGTPDCYIKWAHKCMDKDPQKRPSAWEIHREISYWLEMLSLDDENEIKKQFIIADETVKSLSIIPQKHSHYICSRMISMENILEALTSPTSPTFPTFPS